MEKSIGVLVSEAGKLILREMFVVVRNVSFNVPESHVGALQTSLHALWLHDVIRRATEASLRGLSHGRRRSPGRYAAKTNVEALSKVWLRVYQFGAF